MTAPKESVIVGRIRTALVNDGYFVRKINGNGYQQKGLPDLIAIDHHGRFVGLQVKRPKPSGYGATALQVYTLNQINACGGFGAIVRSVQEAQKCMRLSQAGRTVDGCLEAGDMDD